MSEISIVTAFFDIGRSEWTPDKGLPHYLQRSTATYFERFAHMATLENEMVVFTSPEFKDRILELRGDNPTHVITVDFKTLSPDLRKHVSQIQQSEEYQVKINPAQVKNPEYWNTDYVLVNLFKASFVNQALWENLITNDLVAWLDFGYCRDESTLNGVTKWEYPFNQDKIHLFNIKDFVEGTYIIDVIVNNDVHITGPCIVSGKTGWSRLGALVKHNTDQLIINDLIDDDQTILLMSYLMQPELFELHKVSNSDWFVAFKEYHASLS
jgi:protein YibB